MLYEGTGREAIWLKKMWSNIDNLQGQDAIAVRTNNKSTYYCNNWLVSKKEPFEIRKQFIHRVWP